MVAGHDAVEGVLLRGGVCVELHAAEPAELRLDLQGLLDGCGADLEHMGHGEAELGPASIDAPAEVDPLDQPAQLGEEREELHVKPKHVVDALVRLVREERAVVVDVVVDLLLPFLPRVGLFVPGRPVERRFRPSRGDSLRRRLEPAHERVDLGLGRLERRREAREHVYVGEPADEEVEKLGLLDLRAHVGSGRGIGPWEIADQLAERLVVPTQQDDLPSTLEVDPPLVAREREHHERAEKKHERQGEVACGGAFVAEQSQQVAQRPAHQGLLDVVGDGLVQERGAVCNAVRDHEGHEPVVLHGQRWEHRLERVARVDRRVCRREEQRRRLEEEVERLVVPRHVQEDVWKG